MYATRRFAGAAVAALTAALVAALAPAEPAGAAVSFTCSAASVPQPLNAGNVFLTGVAAYSKTSGPSNADAWEVGYSSTSGRDHAFIGRFAAGQLSLVRFPVPAGAYNTMLNGVAAASTSNAWAVGYSAGGSVARTLIEHWTGTAWRLVVSPNPAGARRSVLTAVTALSPGTAWAVGYYLTAAGTRQPLIERWAGGRWQQVRSPGQGGAGWSSILNAVTVTGTADAWAVGESSRGASVLGLVERWNGSMWRVAPGATDGGYQPDLTGVAATSADNAWAVGSFNSGEDTFVEHWNGAAWSDIGSPNPGMNNHANALLGVAASSGGGIWTVGYYTYNGGVLGTVTEPFFMHMAADGTPLFNFPGIPYIGVSQTYDLLRGVTAINASSALAVGNFAKQASTVVHYAYGASCRTAS